MKDNNAEHAPLSREKFTPQYNKCLSCGKAYVEKQWNLNFFITADKFLFQEDTFQKKVT
jgi:hypothetical protein